MSFNFGLIPSLTTELAAPERLKNIVTAGFLGQFYSKLVLILADDFNWHKIFSERKEEKAGCFAIIVLQMYCYYKCFVTIPHGAVGWSSVCECGIS